VKTWHRWGQSVGVAMVVASALVVAACGGTSSSNNSSTQVNRSGTITIWHGYEGTYLDTKKAILDQYSKQYPNVTINLVHKPNLTDAVTAAAGAGQGPDIVAWVDDQIGKWVKLEAIKPIDGLAGVDSNYMNSTYTKAAVDADTFEGKIYGVPEAVEAITILYNKKLISADQIPKTNDDLVAFAKSYSTQHPGSYGVVWNPKDAYFQAPWIYGSGGFYVKADGTVGLNTSGTKAGFNFVASFKGLMPAGVDYGIADTLFKEGKAAMIINGPWSVADYKKAGVDYGIATLPTITTTSKPASPFVGVKTWMLGQYSTNPALAVDVMKYFTNQANQTTMVLGTGEIPANKAALADPKVQAITDIAGFGAQVKNGVPLPNTPFMSALWDPVAKALEAVWTGKQSVDSALSDAQTAAEKNVAQLK
jgi:arabinogalactan oligomer / maltooligosaccharide transport system substrate-binding protein